ncbi:MAG: hypothetical protein JJT75_14790 [Opitutales bacterium]|nr:hypothetical protein [Opitutales bacterium]MCH8541770.1 hypothetical protein [Opitutales bacterium]
MPKQTCIKTLSVFILFLQGSFLWGGERPGLGGAIPRVIPIEEKVSISVLIKRVEREQGSYELRLETMAGKGEALFENGKNRFLLDETRRAYFSGSVASSQMNNMALSLYHNEERIDTILLTFVNPDLIRFDEAIAAAHQRFRKMEKEDDTEDKIWEIHHPNPSVILLEEINLFVVQYPSHFVSKPGSTRGRIRVTFMVDAKTGEIEYVFSGGAGPGWFEAQGLRRRRME